MTSFSRTFSTPQVGGGRLSAEADVLIINLSACLHAPPVKDGLISLSDINLQDLTKVVMKFQSI